MTPTKILIGQIAVVFAIVLGSLWVATQWAAAMLGYQARLGAPWFDLFGWPVYLPWRLFAWWCAFDAYAPWVFEKAGTLAASGGLIGSLVAVIGSLWRARQTRLVTTYGSSRWATRAEVEEAGRRPWATSESSTASWPPSSSTSTRGLVCWAARSASSPRC